MDLKDTIRRLCEENDRDAFDTLYFTLEDRIFRYILARVRDRQRAKEILQDVFIDIWKGRTRFTYHSDAQFYGFVFLITKRKIIRHVEVEKKHAHGSIDEEFHADEAHREKVDTDFLRKAIGSLKESYREVVELRYWSGLSFKEIGDMVGKSEEAVRVRHHRALTSLDKYYKKHE